MGYGGGSSGGGGGGAGGGGAGGGGGGGTVQSQGTRASGGVVGGTVALPLIRQDGKQEASVVLVGGSNGFNGSKGGSERVLRYTLENY